MLAYPNDPAFCAAKGCSKSWVAVSGPFGQACTVVVPTPCAPQSSTWAVFAMLDTTLGSFSLSVQSSGC